MKTMMFVLEIDDVPATVVEFGWEEDAARGRVLAVRGYDAERLHEHLHEKLAHFPTDIFGWLVGNRPHDYLWLNLVLTDRVNSRLTPFTALDIRTPPRPEEYRPNIKKHRDEPYGDFIAWRHVTVNTREVEPPAVVEPIL